MRQVRRRRRFADFPHCPHFPRFPALLAPVAPSQLTYQGGDIVTRAARQVCQKGKVGGRALFGCVEFVVKVLHDGFILVIRGAEHLA